MTPTEGQTTTEAKGAKPGWGFTPLFDEIQRGGKFSPFQMKPGLQWMTTEPSPRSARTGWDAGQRGWRLHAFDWTEADNEYHRETGHTRSRKPALCGLRPAHGWGVDLFIEDECERCLKAIEKRESTGAKTP